MFKDYNKYLSTSLKVYLFVLIIIFIMKLIGLDYFGLDINNKSITYINDLIEKYNIIGNILYTTMLLFNLYVIVTTICNDKSTKIKIYLLVVSPLFLLIQHYKLFFGMFSIIIELSFFALICFIYTKKINKNNIKRFFIINLIIIFMQSLSTITRFRYSIEYVSNISANIILNLDYIIMLIILYKINFMEGGVKICGSQEVQFLSLLKKINLLKLLKRLQKRLNNFKKQDKETKLTIIIYSILSLIWNVFTVFIVLLFAKLNNTFIECIFILTSFWLSKRSFGKAFHLSSMMQCFIVSNLSYYLLNRLTTPLGISIIVPIMLGVGLSYLTSKLVKKVYKPLYRGMPVDLFEETILKVVDKDSNNYKICYEYFIDKKSAVSLSMKYNYSEAGIKKIKDRINNKIKELN